MPFPARAGADACPGVFATHDAADGALARVRLPGGAISSAQLRVLAGCADELGDGAVHLTSRGNLQLRGLDRDAPELVTRLSAAGLLPSPSHERARNILASPLSGLTGGFTDLSGLAARLDAALCARPELAELPGRFLFALDDGRDDVSGERADVCWRAVDAGTGALVLDGSDTGLRVPSSRAVDALMTLAQAFATTRGSAWRVRELPDPTSILDSVHDLATDADPIVLPARPGLPIGLISQDDGGVAVGLAPPLGRLPAAQLRVLADVAERAFVTPWRSLLLPDVRADVIDVLAGAGLVVDPDAPSLGVSACIGRPGCAKSRADVRADASTVLPGLPVGFRAHFAGCERRCGKPAADHVDVLAEGGGYLVDDIWVSAEELAEALKQKRLEEK
jgi:precorrin-3B synthase